MVKLVHEFRDPVHSFVHVDGDERRVIDSAPVQRLRHIHQLAMTYLVYPGATHRRFEHSLGVMELAGRIFDVVTTPGQIPEVLGDVLPELLGDRSLPYWRAVLRMAALCHDVGHLPFSHAAEERLLPAGTTHEDLTVALIRGEPLRSIWESLDPPLRSESIARVAVGARHFREAPLSRLETVLAEMITGGAFGADRMDYLLRDSLHVGVAYGRFDLARLIESLRILPTPIEGGELSPEPQLGIEEGGLRSAEALLLARYFMFSQVYLHRVRRIFDIHLQDFLVAYADAHLPEGRLPTHLAAHLQLTDAEVTAALLAAARDPDLAGHAAARRIVERDPFKLLWERTPSEAERVPYLGLVIEQAAKAEFGEDAVRRDEYPPGIASIDFLVRRRNGDVVSARSLSDVLSNLPSASVDLVFVAPERLREAQRWLTANLPTLRTQVPSEE